MTYFGGKALIVTSFLMVCLLGSAASAQTDSSPNVAIPQSNNLNDGQDSTILTATITLHWTAPGDDGSTGRASRYDLRARPAPYGPIDSQVEWDQAHQFSNEPTPAPAGQMDSMTITGFLPGSQYYLCIRTYDEVNNISDFSNALLTGGSIPNIFIAGDVNNSGRVDGLDVVFLVSSMKGRCAVPEPQLRADINGLPGVNDLDVAYLRAYLSGGPAPQKSEDAPVITGPNRGQAIISGRE